jgi:hypothetical protein
MPPISFKKKIKDNNMTALLYLKGIVYHGENHFTSRIITKDGKIWFNDGLQLEAKVLKKVVFLQ